MKVVVKMLMKVMVKVVMKVIFSCLMGFADNRTDRQRNKQTDICDCRVASMTEKS